MVHCIRGAGSTIGLFALSHLAQYQEDTLEQILNGQLTWNNDVGAVLESATARIGEYLNGITTGQYAERSVVTDLVKAFRRLRGLPEEEDEREIAQLLGEPESEAAVPDEAEGLSQRPAFLSFEVAPPV